MAFKTENGLIGESDIGKTFEKYQVKPPEELQFPASFKLDEKFALHLDRRGLVYKDGRYEQGYSFLVTKNQVVQHERGE